MGKFEEFAAEGAERGFGLDGHFCEGILDRSVWAFTSVLRSGLLFVGNCLPYDVGRLPSVAGWTIDGMNGIYPQDKTAA